MKILAIGAHPDDIEIGCGGTLLYLKRSHDATLHTYVLTYGGASNHGAGSRESEQSAANKILQVNSFRCAGLSDTQLHTYNLVSMIEEVIDDVDPDIIFTHYANDTHQDHRAVAEATVSACRYRTNLLFYESFSTENFQPTLLVDIGKTIHQKCEAVAAHVLQDKHLELTDYVRTLAKYRSHRTCLNYTEAFLSRKLIWT